LEVPTAYSMISLKISYMSFLHIPPIP
jgi:hypothetical protein